VKTTWYFERRVLRDRPYLRENWETWCGRILANPIREEVQPDGRWRFWGGVEELGGRILRVVTLEDRETVHNVFIDGRFTRRRRRGQ
jgi:hypothetical protein